MIFLYIYKVLRGLLEGRKRTPPQRGRCSCRLPGKAYALAFAAASRAAFSCLASAARWQMGVPSHAQRKTRQRKSAIAIPSNQIKTCCQIFISSDLRVVDRKHSYPKIVFYFYIYKAFLPVLDGIFLALFYAYIYKGFIP